MTEKIFKIDIRKVSQKLRNGIDGIDTGDLRLTSLLGFFHRFFIELASKFQIPLDLDVLNAVIADYVEKSKMSPLNNLELPLNGFNLTEYFHYFGNLMNSGDPNHVMYLFGFSHGILNRLMRKLSIPYQIPLPF